MTKKPKPNSLPKNEFLLKLPLMSAFSTLPTNKQGFSPLGEDNRMLQTSFIETLNQSSFQSFRGSFIYGKFSSRENIDFWRMRKVLVIWKEIFQVSKVVTFE